MAVSKNGNDGYIGKSGNTVTYMMNGKMVRRQIGVHTKPPTIKQLPSMQITGLVTAFLHPVRTFVKIGFQLEGKAALKNAYTMVTSHTRLHAIKGIYPNQSIDFEKVLFSKGQLPVLEDASAELITGGVRFTWNPRLLHSKQKLNDRSLLMAYSVDTGDAFYQLNGSRRQIGADYIQLPEFNREIKLETYLAFVSADQTIISNSVYLGQMTLLPSSSQ